MRVRIQGSGFRDEGLRSGRGCRQWQRVREGFGFRDGRWTTSQKCAAGSDAGSYLRLKDFVSLNSRLARDTEEEEGWVGAEQKQGPAQRLALLEKIN